MSTLSDIKPASIRKYPYEWGLIVLGFATAFLFVKLDTLNSYIRETQSKVIQENTNALQIFNNNFYNVKIKEYIK